MTAVIPIRQHTVTRVERFAEYALKAPIQAELSSDESWSPRTQSTVTFDSYPVQWPDPSHRNRQGDWMLLRLATFYAERFTLAELTATHGGSVAAVTAAHGGSTAPVTAAHTRPWNPAESLQPLSAATGLWGGDTAAVTTDIGGSTAAATRALRVPGGSYLPARSEYLTAQLIIRDISEDPAAGTITYRLASDDARLHDYRRTVTTPATFTTTSLRTLVHQLLEYLVDPYGVPPLAAGPDTEIIPPIEWKPAQTIWDVLAPILEVVGWELYADLSGVFQLRPRIPAAASVGLDADTNLIEIRPATDMARAAADGAIIEYEGGDPEAPATRYDVFTMPGAKRILHETRDGVKPGPGAAERLVSRARARAHTATARTLWELSLAAGQEVAVALPAAVTTPTGIIQSISWDTSTRESVIELRDITT